uniref:Uncharacterized protein n=1 Tax=Eutreptiella gymnastica TaxID=73025 RepID=A0A7S1I367_9EUGL
MAAPSAPAHTTLPYRTLRMPGRESDLHLLWVFCTSGLAPVVQGRARAGHWIMNMIMMTCLGARVGAMYEHTSAPHREENVFFDTCAGRMGSPQGSSEPRTDVPLVSPGSSAPHREENVFFDTCAGRMGSPPGVIRASHGCPPGFPPA